MIIPCRTRSLSSRRLAVVVAALVSASLAACVHSTAPLEANPVITFTLDPTVVTGDSIHGEVIATDSHQLTSLEVTVYDTAGRDSTGQIVGGGSVTSASKLDDKFTYKVVRTAPGGYVYFSAIAFNLFGDSTIVRDSTLVTP
jgi:hypothetical protein